MPLTTTVRIARGTRFVEDGGAWYVGINEYPKSTKMAYIRKELADVQAAEPDAGWRLEVRTEGGAWRPIAE
jgi:hypothetical protein